MFKTRGPGLVIRSHSGNLVRTFQLEIQRAGDFLFFFLDLSGARLIPLVMRRVIRPYAPVQARRILVGQPLTDWGLPS